RTWWRPAPWGRPGCGSRAKAPAPALSGSDLLQTCVRPPSQTLRTCATRETRIRPARPATADLLQTRDLPDPRPGTCVRPAARVLRRDLAARGLQQTRDLRPARPASDLQACRPATTCRPRTCRR